MIDIAFKNDFLSSSIVLKSDEDISYKGKGAHWIPWSRGTGLTKWDFSKSWVRELIIVSLGKGGEHSQKNPNQNSVNMPNDFRENKQY